jgi:Calsyntenin C-terminal
VVVVVAVCVLLLLTVLAVGVLRLRSAHKRAAEEEVEMAWDDTALNITVNPLEASILQTITTTFRVLPNTIGQFLE